MDLGLIFGLLGTWALLMFALMLGGNVAGYVDPASLILVGGASITMVFFCYPARNVKGIFSVVKRAIFFQSGNIPDLIGQMVKFAEIARRDGILALESAMGDVEDPFIIRGMQMAVDGTDPELIEQILTSELENVVERHDVGKGMMDAIGKYAPAFGMIGTLVGLVAMLAGLDDPAKIGPGMAIALLTTFYGAVIANAMALPLSDRLVRRSAEEVMYKTVIIKGVMSIQSGDNPRVVEQKLRTFLPPSQRAQMEAAEAA